MTQTLGERLSALTLPLSDDQALEVFLAWVDEAGISLYPAQEEAILALFEGRHVVLKTPTGSGKSMVALAMHFRDLAAGRRSVYTAPIKALVSEKFFALCGALGAERVGMLTGDGTVNADAPVICCTAEVLSLMALRQGSDTPFTSVVMDEFHFYGDRDRGMAWQVPLLRMNKTRFLLMSATLGDTTAIERDLQERTGAEVAVVRSSDRPVPLTFQYSELPLLVRLSSLVSMRKAPVYAVSFKQRAATELAQALLSHDYADPEEKAALKRALKGFKFDSPFGPTLRRMLLHGVAVHHAGLLPKYRLLVEKLSQQALFKVICGTDTLGVGINVPIRTVLFTQLCKYDGDEVSILSVRHFQQIAGRAGRKGFDDEGLVVAQAPDWVIENQRLKAAMAAGTKSKKVRLSQAPTKGYKHWDETTFDRLVNGQPEPLESRFEVGHELVLAMLRKAEEDLGDPIEELRALVRTSHASERAKEKLLVEVEKKLLELVAAGVVTHHPDEVPEYVVDPELQDDFALHHPLSLFLVHAIPHLDMASPSYALDLLSLVESVHEHPKPVLFAQVNRAKAEKIAELKAAGVPYEERLEALEEVTWPKPGAERLYALYEAYAESHPWLAAAPIRPKCVARELVETLSAFSGYVQGLELTHLEGVLLRYLTQVYKTLVQNVPADRRTEEVDDVVAFLRAMLARVDDSLLTAWEDMLAPGVDTSALDQPVDISADTKAFRARIRAELHAVVRALAMQDWAEAAASVRQSEDEPFPPEAFEAGVAGYMEAWGPVVYDGRSRQGWNTQIEQEGSHRWRVRQILVPPLHVDAEEVDAAWSIEGVVDLREDTNPSGPIVRVVGISG
jgi:superfamily II RNA helicase